MTPGPEVARVVPDLPSGPPAALYDYLVPEALRERIQVGQRVLVPFGRRRVFAFVVELPSRPAVDSLREIEELEAEEPLLLPHLVALAQWISDYYLAPIPEVVRAMIPPALRRGRPGGKRRKPRVAVDRSQESAAVTGELRLSEAQESASGPIEESIRWNRFEEFLLLGVTGSGKTEVYLAAIRCALAQGRGAVVLIPEISLTPQTVARFSVHFPGQLAVLHSGLTVAERGREWRRVRSREARVVIGSRSAVFAPMPDPGVIVVDEEDSSSYKQYDRTPRYQAVEVARHLARLLSVPVVLGSATPRLESYLQAQEGRLKLLSLKQRYQERPLPPVQVVDLREELAWGNRSPFSRRLTELVGSTLEQGGQVILFLNRRGSSSVVLCRACGDSLDCPNCSVSLTLHHHGQGCVCHYCGHHQPLPGSCPQCGSKLLRALGAGTERVEAEAVGLWPRARILRMDRDTVGHRDAHREIYEAFARREADILIGTQMVAKGWDLPGVQLVGIVNADIALHFPDFRASERTFSLLTQVAGRAGRGDEPAQVVLQTYSPEHTAVQFASQHDFEGFAALELDARRRLGFPPFAKMVVATISAADDARAQRVCEQEAKRLRESVKGSGLEVMGPSPAFIPRLRSLYRWQITVRGPKIDPVRALLPQGRGWAIDVDPG